MRPLGRVVCQSFLPAAARISSRSQKPPEFQDTLQALPRNSKEINVVRFAFDSVSIWLRFASRKRPAAKRKAGPSQSQQHTCLVDGGDAPEIVTGCFCSYPRQSEDESSSVIQSVG